ncbi:MAG: HD domain-containing protein [Clostridiales bacterium]|nr:HD domain-containing protein [Clostridiales bacterium]
MFERKTYLRTDIEKLYYNDLPSSVKTQLKALMSLDIYTKKHIEDVPKYVYKICKQANLHQEQIDFAMTAAYLHDVGKIFIKSEILQKNDRLTEEEYEEMKTHTIKGYEICMSFDELNQYAPVVRGHHENLDGTGYPDGLKDNEISYTTRIVKVADVYSALLNKRQYKEAFSTRKIFEIIYEDVKNNKTDGEILCLLLSAIIDDKKEELKEIKHNFNNYVSQLEYNENIFECLNSYITERMKPENILRKIKENKYIHKLEGFEIENFQDINKLLIYINNNIINLTKSIKQKENLEKDIKDLNEFFKLTYKKVK